MIKRATINDLPLLDKIGVHFAKENKISSFNIDIFIQKWSHFLKQGTGIVFLAYKNGIVAGAVGGLIAPDMWTDELTLIEIFWIVLPEYRGVDLIGLKLFSTFEQYAKENKIKRILVGHMMVVNPKKMEKVYLFKNYKPIERYYIKEVM